MTRLLAALLAAALGLLAALAVPAAAQRKIVVDAGHGGGDPGGVGTGLQEKAIVLDVTQRFAALLEADTADPAGGGAWTTLFTRASDTDVSLAARSAYANANGADRFMSIHSNAFADPAANGTETFSFASTGTGAALRNLVQAEMIAAWGLTNRGNKTANFAVLRETAAPAVLHELAFITNATDAAKLASPTEREKAAVAHLRAIQRHYGIAPHLPGAPPMTGRGEIAGRVVDDLGPIAGAAVRLDTGEERVTGEDGAFVFEGVAAGAHALTASAEGHEPGAAEIAVASGARAELELPLIRLPDETSEDGDGGGCGCGTGGAAGGAGPALTFTLATLAALAALARRRPRRRPRRHRRPASRAAAALACAALLAACGLDDREGETAQAMAVCADGPTVFGIDVSRFQGAIDWDQVAGAGVVFAYIQISRSLTDLDPRFEENWRRAKEVGILRGAYQRFRPGQDVDGQADIFLQKLGAPVPGDLPPMLDVEDADGLPAQTIAARVRQWIDRVEPVIGVRPLVYTGFYFWRDQVGGADLSAYPLWIANYSATCPLVPPAWTRWAIHQYSSTLTLPGITANTVDANRFNGTRAQLEALAIPPPSCHGPRCGGAVVVGDGEAIEATGPEVAAPDVAGCAAGGGRSDNHSGGLATGAPAIIAAAWALARRRRRSPPRP